MLRKVTVLGVFVSLLAALAPVASASSSKVGSYIVVLKDSVNDPRAVAREHARSQNARLGFVYEHALKGYSAKMSEQAAARIANDRRVDYVEADGVVHKVDVQTSPQMSPVWGLDRIDQRSSSLDSRYTYNYTGAGVKAYIIDTGISSHSDFAGRLQNGYDFVSNDSISDDCDGHGTHVAGTVAGSRYGVAKAATLVGVRVLNCSGSGTWSGVIAGVDWVTDHAQKPAVANMSLGGGASSSVNQAVASSIASGITYAVAAGNGNQGGKAQDACNYSPAGVTTALTVGATSSSDSKASWSNYGQCVDLFAPGVGITSTVMGDGTGTETWSGTSMATPHVAGVAALYLQSNPAASSSAVSAAITTGATKDVVGNAGPGSPNLLLYSLLTASAPPSDDPAAPVAVDDAATATTGSTVNVPVLANDTDANGDTTLTVASVGTASGGTAVAASDNKSINYTAPVDPGVYTFTYTASDGTLTSNSATVTVTVSEPSAGATTATVSYRMTGGRAADKHLIITVVLTDAIGNTVPATSIDISIALDGVPRWTGAGTTSSTGSVSWEIKNASNGTYVTTLVNVAGSQWSGDTEGATFDKQ